MKNDKESVNEVMRRLEGIQQKVGELGNDGDPTKRLNKLFIEVAYVAHSAHSSNSNIRSAFYEAKHMFITNKTVDTLNEVINKMKESIQQTEGIQQAEGIQDLIKRLNELYPEVADTVGLTKRLNELYLEVADVALSCNRYVTRAFWDAKHMFFGNNDGDPTKRLNKLFLEVADVVHSPNSNSNSRLRYAFYDTKHMFLKNKTLFTLNEVINKIKMAGHHSDIYLLDKVIRSLEGIQQKVGELDNDGDLIKEKLIELYIEIMHEAFHTEAGKSAFYEVKHMFLDNRTIVTLNNFINKMKESLEKEIDTLFVKDALNGSLNKKMKRLDGIQQKVVGELGKLTPGFCRSICDKHFKYNEVSLFKNYNSPIEDLTPIVHSYLGL